MLESHIQFSEVLYFTPTSLEKAGGFWPIRLGRNVAKPPYNEGPRYVNHYSLHFILEGSGTFVQDNCTYSLVKGDLFCLFPRISHQYFTDKENLLKMIWIAFDGKQALPILNRIGIRPYSPHLPAVMNEEIVNLLHTLFAFFQQPGNDNQDFVRQSEFFKLFHTLLGSLPGGQNNDHNDFVSWLDKGLEYMNMHYTEGITVEEAAKYVGVDRTHFSKRFQKRYGVSPSEYLKSLLMKEAGQMVKETNYSFTEIAFSVGFPDLYSFSKAYKKYYGVSPTESRHSYLQSVEGLP
jgi:AraC-like DNA-binding protein